MNKRNPILAVLGFLAMLAASAAAQVTDATSLGTELSSGITDVTPTLWTIGGVMAAVVATVVVIGLLLRNGKSVGKSA